MTRETVTKIVGYVRVSGTESGERGDSFENQREQIEAEAKRKGWEIVAWCQDTGSGNEAEAKRSGLREALEIVKAGEADAIVAYKFDRVSRNMSDFMRLYEQAKREGWMIHALDFFADLTTPEGMMMAQVLMAFAQFERGKARERNIQTKQKAKARGARLGRTVTMPGETRDRVVELHAMGLSLNAIAQQLNDEGAATATGKGKFYAQSVKQILRSVALDREAESLRAAAARA